MPDGQLEVEVEREREGEREVGSEGKTEVEKEVEGRLKPISNPDSNPREGGLKPKRIGIVVVANAPVRIDLAGGWSDTPPICYQTQGAVSNSHL
jgi:hypothetical protein